MIGVIAAVMIGQENLAVFYGYQIGHSFATLASNYMAMISHAMVLSSIQEELRTHEGTFRDDIVISS